MDSPDAVLAHETRPLSLPIGGCGIGQVLLPFESVQAHSRRHADKTEGRKEPRLRRLRFCGISSLEWGERDLALLPPSKAPVLPRPLQVHHETCAPPHGDTMATIT
jgi:hypothetical protein